MGRIHSFAILAALVAATVPALAQQPPAQVYISNESQKYLEFLDFTQPTPKILYNIGAQPDDMVVNSAGQIIYTVPKTGTVNLFDPSTGQNTVLASITYVRDLEIEPGGQTMLIARYTGPAEIIRYSFVTGTWSVLVGKAGKLGTCDGIAYDQWGNLYAVSNHNTIVQINPTTGAILATLVLEPHHNVNGGDGLTWDPYTQSLWATHDGTTGIGLLQIFVNQNGFVSTTSSGFQFFPLPGIVNVDGLKSDGLGNLYVAAIWNALVYNIPSQTITHNVIVKGADGIGLVPGSF